MFGPAMVESSAMTLRTLRGRIGASRLAALAGGLVAAASFEPVGFGVAAPLSMGLLWWSIQRETARGAAAAGLCFGLSFMLPLMWWLEASIGFAAWLALGSAQALMLVVSAVGLHSIRTVPGAPLWGGLIWVTVETLRSNWPLGGMPWGRLGIAAIDTPWEPLLAYAGISGTGVLVASVGFATAQIVSQRTAVTWGVLLILVTGAFLAISIPVRLPVVGSAAVAAVQGGVPGDGTDLVAHHREVTRDHAKATQSLAESLTSQARTVDLVVWPENATAVDPFDDSIARGEIQRAARAVGAPLLAGAITDGPTEQTAFNRGILWLPDGSASDFYTKSHPVPFGEYIPWRQVIGDWFPRFDEIPRDMLAGNDEGPLEVDGLTVADAICFDVAYDDVLPAQVQDGARLVVVQTSNATFTGTSQPAQQFQITRARAVELGRAVVVASTNGISGIIDADGEVRAQTTSNSASVLVDDVDLHDALTPAVRYWVHRDLAITAGTLLGLGWAWVIASAGRRPRRL